MFGQQGPPEREELSLGNFKNCGKQFTPANSTDGPESLSVRILKTENETRGHRALWEWPGTRDSDLDFFLRIAGAQTEVLRPRVYVAYRGNAAEAVLMGRLESRPIPMQLGHLHLESPRLRVLDFIYGGLRGNIAQDTTEALVKEVLQSLHRGEADVALFEPVTLDSELWRALRTLPNLFERGFCGTQQNHYGLQLPRRSEELHERMPHNQRRDYQRKGRKLIRDFAGDVCCRWYREASPEMYRDLEYVAERSFQRGLGVGFQDTTELRQSWELAASKGWLRVCVLYAGGKPCAFWTGMAYRGTLWCDYMAYNWEFASYSPGMYLALHSFGELSDQRAEHGIREISLGPGDSGLKSLLNCTCKHESSVYLYAPTLLGAALNVMLSLVFLADGSARRCLTRENAFAKILRRLRHEQAVRSLACYRSGELGAS